MKIKSKDFRVKPGDAVKLEACPTSVQPVYESKKQYQTLLEEHVEELSALQRLHYASSRYALLLILQGMDAAGKPTASSSGPRSSCGATSARHCPRMPCRSSPT